MSKETKKNTNINDDNNTITNLSLKGEIILVYLFTIFGLIFSILDNGSYSKRAKFAYNQSGTLAIISIVLWIFGFIPFIGIVFRLFNVVVFIFAIIAMVRGYNGEDYKIVLVSDISDIIWNNKTINKEEK